ncbi:MAG: 2OG-Fe(II) oxygenase [Rhodospirillaceae bacterium]|nr:2OG-Fe(II) oxygenase [Rhodospirillaceae bacterium]
MFIEEYPGVVSPDLCQKIIALFEADPGKNPSEVNLRGKVKTSSIRTGMRLKPVAPPWQPILKDLAPAFIDTMRNYVVKYEGLQYLANSEELVFVGPVMERVQPGQGFAWHIDHSSATWQRVVAGLLYLNTVDDGGSTEFADQKLHVKCEAGKIALFPPFWTHFHRGVSPVSQTKYVMGYFWQYPMPANT